MTKRWGVAYTVFFEGLRGRDRKVKRHYDAAVQFAEIQPSEADLRAYAERRLEALNVRRGRCEVRVYPRAEASDYLGSDGRTITTIAYPIMESAAVVSFEVGAGLP